MLESANSSGGLARLVRRGCVGGDKAIPLSVGGEGEVRIPESLDRKLLGLLSLDRKFFGLLSEPRRWRSFSLSSVLELCPSWWYTRGYLRAGIGGGTLFC